MTAAGFRKETGSIYIRSDVVLNESNSAYPD